MLNKERTSAPRNKIVLACYQFIIYFDNQQITKLKYTFNNAILMKHKYNK